MSDVDLANRLLEEAHSLFNHGKYSIAIPKFEAAIRNLSDDSDKAIAFMNIGICYSNLGVFDDARDYFNGAIKMNSKYAPAFYNRGVMHQQLDDLESALADYDKAIELVPDYASAYNEKGSCLAEKNNLEDALECFKTAARIFPKEQSFLGNVGKAYL